MIESFRTHVKKPARLQRAVSDPGHTLSGVNKDLRGSHAHTGLLDAKMTDLMKCKRACIVSAEVVATLNEMPLMQ